MRTGEFDREFTGGDRFFATPGDAERPGLGGRPANPCARIVRVELRLGHFKNLESAERQGPRARTLPS